MKKHLIALLACLLLGILFPFSLLFIDIVFSPVFGEGSWVATFLSTIISRMDIFGMFLCSGVCTGEEGLTMIFTLIPSLLLDGIFLGFLFYLMYFFGITKTLRIFLVTIFGLYILGGFILFFFQRQLTYFPDDSDFYTCPAFSDAEKITQGNTRMYLIKKDPDRLVVFYHGNAASACSTGYIRDVIDSSGASVLIPEYSGYAGDDNKPSKDAILKNVYEVTEYLKTHKYASIVVVGESLGTGVASYHASLLKPEKLALISPFSSMKDVARTRFWMYPTIPVSENYDSVQYLREYTGSLLIIHGDSDDVVPPALSQKLLDSVPSLNKNRILIPDGEHEYIWSTPGVRDMVRGFIK